MFENQMETFVMSGLNLMLKGCMATSFFEELKTQQKIIREPDL